MDTKPTCGGGGEGVEKTKITVHQIEPLSLVISIVNSYVHGKGMTGVFLPIYAFSEADKIKN